MRPHLCLVVVFRVLLRYGEPFIYIDEWSLVETDATAARVHQSLDAGLLAGVDDVAGALNVDFFADFLACAGPRRGRVENRISPSTLESGQKGVSGIEIDRLERVALRSGALSKVKGEDGRLGMLGLDRQHEVVPEETLFRFCKLKEKGVE